MGRSSPSSAATTVSQVDRQVQAARSRYHCTAQAAAGLGVAGVLSAIATIVLVVVHKKVQPILHVHNGHNRQWGTLAFHKGLATPRVQHRFSLGQCAVHNVSLLELSACPRVSAHVATRGGQRLQAEGAADQVTWSASQPQPWVAARRTLMDLRRVVDDDTPPEWFGRSDDAAWYSMGSEGVPEWAECFRAWNVLPFGGPVGGDPTASISLCNMGKQCKLLLPADGGHAGNGPGQPSCYELLFAPPSCHGFAMASETEARALQQRLLAAASVPCWHYTPARSRPRSWLTLTDMNVYFNETYPGEITTQGGQFVMILAVAGVGCTLLLWTCAMVFGLWSMRLSSDVAARGVIGAGAAGTSTANHVGGFYHQDTLTPISDASDEHGAFQPPPMGNGYVPSSSSSQMLLLPSQEDSLHGPLKAESSSSLGDYAPLPGLAPESAGPGRHRGSTQPGIEAVPRQSTPA